MTAEEAVVIAFVPPRTGAVCRSSGYTGLRVAGEAKVTEQEWHPFWRW